MSYIYGPPINTQIVARNSVGTGHHALDATAGRHNSRDPEPPFHRIDPTLSPALGVADARANSKHSSSKHRRVRTQQFADSFYPYAGASGSHEPDWRSVYTHTSPHSSFKPAIVSSLPPLNHTRLPQIQFAEPASAYPYGDSSFRSPTVFFQHAGYQEVGVRVGDVVNCMQSPVLVAGGAKAFRGGYCEIEVRIAWPGYKSEQFQRTISTQNANITVDDLLKGLANVVLAFTEGIRKLNIPVERGFERWAVGMHPNGKKGLTGLEVYITSLHHRGRASWQPELWIPKQTC